MERKVFLVAGGDLRQRALVSLLAADGHRVHTLGLGEEDAPPEQWREADCVLLPLPVQGEDGRLFTPLSPQTHPAEELLRGLSPGQTVLGGMVRPALRRLAAACGLRLADYFEREELAVRNAVPTAEGAIRIAMEELPVTLQGCMITVIGFGRVGMALVPRLRGLGASVLVAARDPSARALARSMGAESCPLTALAEELPLCGLVVNTVPAPVLGRRELAALAKGTPVIELASRPGGADLSAARELGVRIRSAPGLPGREAPLSAGGYLRDTVYQMLEELGV